MNSCMEVMCHILSCFLTVKLSTEMSFFKSSLQILSYSLNDTCISLIIGSDSSLFWYKYGIVSGWLAIVSLYLNF